MLNNVYVWSDNSIRSKFTAHELCFGFLFFFGLVNEEDGDDDYDGDSTDNVLIIFNCGI